VPEALTHVPLVTHFLNSIILSKFSENIPWSFRPLIFILSPLNNYLSAVCTSMKKLTIHKYINILFFSLYFIDISLYHVSDNFMFSLLPLLLSFFKSGCTFHFLFSLKQMCNTCICVCLLWWRGNLLSQLQ